MARRGLARSSTAAFVLGAATLLAACAAGDEIDPSGAAGPTGPGSGGGTSGSGGEGGAGTPSSTSTDATTSTSSAPDTTTVGPGGGEGGSTSSGGGEGGGTGGGSGGEGGQGGSGVPVCGNGVLEAGETCDGEQLGGETCTTIGQGFEGGTLGCTDACELDTSGCVAPPDCGNGIIEAGEDCDGAQLGGATCQTEGFSEGTIACAGGCLLDTSDCSTCGDDLVSGDELCDGANLDGFDCIDLAHDGGTLSCAANCLSFVQTACSDCGDGQVEAPEACDGSNFAGATCANQGFTGGTLLCTQACGTISTANCYECGDGQVEGAEVCDGANFDGQTCLGLGFDLGGTLACNAGCLGFNTVGCVNSQCNDGIDNDGDGFVDFSADLGCTSALDASENQYVPQCNGNGNPIFDTGYPLFSVSYFQPFNTTGFPDVSDAPCQGNTGPEIWFVYRNEQFQPDIWIYTWDTADPAEMTDTVITVHRGSCTGPSQCDDDTGDGNHARVIVTNVAAGELLFVKVEGWATQAGYGELVFDLFNNEG